MDRSEVRITSETGGQKGDKLAKIGAIDPLALYELAEVAGKGAEKYSAFNYIKGYDWSLSYNAMQRHMMLFWAGEDNDPETGKSHMAHAAWHALCLVTFGLRELGTDDRITTVLEDGDDDESPLTKYYRALEAMSKHERTL